MSRWLSFSLISLLLLAGTAQAAENPTPKRIAVVPLIPAAAAGPRLPDTRTAAAANTLARSLGQIQGVVVSNASAVYHATLAEGGVGGTTPLIAVKVARRVEANLAILVEASGKDKDLALTATVVAAEGEKTRVPAPIARQGTINLGTDFFNIQSDFVLAVIDALDIKASDAEKTRINFVLRATANPQAFDSYALACRQMPVATLEAYDYAVGALRNAVAADKDYALAHAALSEAATLLSMQQALTGLRDERTKTLAVTEAEQATRLRPELPDTHRALALAETLVQNSARASAAAKEALNIHAEDPGATLWLGLANGADGKETIGKALKLDPGLALGHLFLAVLAAGEGDRKLLQAECDKALALSPMDPSPLLLIGLLQTGEGQIDEAIATYQKVLKINPRTALAYGAIARLYYRRDQKDQARSAMQQAFALDPRIASIMSEQAAAYRQAGQWDEAEKEYRLILLADDKDTPSWRGLGALALDRNRLDEAEKDFRAALAISPKDAWAYIGLSTCHQRQGKSEEALQDLKSATEAQPDEGMVHFYLGQAYEQRNRLREALASYSKAMELSKLLLDAAYRRAVVQEKVDPSLASAAWKDYLSAVDASGGAQTDQEKARVQVAQSHIK
ncbi:MAG TPA: tetratricopeptide repeat protein [Armatimonadota bacterium]|nr:tetratricopeptide repeat protein [Armatimonadota bacterium]